MRRLWLAVTLAVTVAPGLAAQQPPPPPADTGEAGRLRREIEDRFAQRVQADLRLTPDQATKLRATQERFGERRRTLMRQQFERRRAMDEQMQPGIAANPDSVKKLMDGLQAGRMDMVRLEQDEDRDMAGYLTPVQRARYQQMREHLMQRLNEMRQQRRERGGRMGPGPRSRPQGRRPGPGRRPM